MPGTGPASSHILQVSMSYVELFRVTVLCCAAMAITDSDTDCFRLPQVDSKQKQERQGELDFSSRCKVTRSGLHRSLAVDCPLLSGYVVAQATLPVPGLWALTAREACAA